MVKPECTRNNNGLLPQLLAMMVIILLSAHGCMSEKNVRSNTPTVNITLQPEVQLAAPTAPETDPGATSTAVPELDDESLPVQSLDAAATASLVEQGYELSSEAGLRAALVDFFSNPDYSQIQIPDLIRNKWLDFSRNESELTIEEKLDLAQFLDQWLQLDALMNTSAYGRNHRIQLKVQALENSEGRSIIKPYLVDLEDGLETPLLLARDAKGKFIDLVPAPQIPGFRMRAAEDGWHIEYIDDRGRSHADC